MTRVILHRPHLCGGAETVADPARGTLVVGRERHADVTVVQNGVVGPVCLFDLVQRLGDEENTDFVPGHERQRGFEEVEAPQGRKLVEHQQQRPA